MREWAFIDYVAINVIKGCLEMANVVISMEPCWRRHSLDQGLPFRDCGLKNAGSYIGIYMQHVFSDIEATLVVDIL